MFSFNIRSNVREFEQGLTRFEKQQLPTALRNSLNDTAFELRKETIDEIWPSAVTVRNRRFLGTALRVEKASKERPIVAIFDRLGRDFLERLARGGVKRPRGRHVAVPSAQVEAKRSGRGIPKSLRPREVIDNKGGFILKKGGKQLIAQRGGRGKKTLKILYVLANQAVVDKAFPFYDRLRQRTIKVFPRHFAREFDKAVKRARFPR